MKVNNVEPYFNVHPGGIIKDEIEFRGISQRQLAKDIGVSYSQLNEVLNEKRALTPEIALLLEAVLGIQAQPLMTMQSDYNLREARESKSFMQRLANIRRVAAVL